MAVNTSYYGCMVYPIKIQSKVTVGVVEDNKILNLIILYPDCIREILEIVTGNKTWDEINVFTSSLDLFFVSEILKVIKRVLAYQPKCKMNIIIPEPNQTISENAELISDSISVIVESSHMNLGTSISYNIPVKPDGMDIIGNKYDIIINEACGRILIPAYPTIATITDAIEDGYEEIHLQYSYLDNHQPTRMGFINAYNNSDICRANIDKLKVISFLSLSDEMFINTIRGYYKPNTYVVDDEREEIIR